MKEPLEDLLQRYNDIRERYQLDLEEDSSCLSGTEKESYLDDVEHLLVEFVEEQEEE